MMITSYFVVIVLSMTLCALLFRFADIHQQRGN